MAYYAVFNVYGEYNNGSPLYLITTTKKAMICKLNDFLKITFGNTSFQYDNDSLKEDYRLYNGKKLPHYINDDWCTVTDKKTVFNEDLNNAKKCAKNQPIEYMS